MQLESVSPNHATVTLTRNDVLFLRGALRETLEALDDAEFHTRTAATPDQFRDLLAQFRKIHETMKGR